MFCRKSVISTGLLSVLHVTSTLLWTPWLSTICLSTSWGSSRSQMPGYVLLGLVWPPCATRATFRLHLLRTKAGGVGFTNFYLLDLKDLELKLEAPLGGKVKNKIEISVWLILTGSIFTYQCIISAATFKKDKTVVCDNDSVCLFWSSSGRSVKDYPPVPVHWLARTRSAKNWGGFYWLYWTSP